MKWLNVFSARLRALFRREAVIHDIDEEMRIHVEIEMEANVERGIPPDDARRAALMGFGNLDSIRDRAYEVRGGWNDRDITSGRKIRGAGAHQA